MADPTEINNQLGSDIDKETGNFLKKVFKPIPEMTDDPSLSKPLEVLDLSEQALNKKYEQQKQFEADTLQALNEKYEKQKKFEATTLKTFTEFSKLPSKIKLKEEGFVQESNIINAGKFKPVTYWTPEVLCTYFNEIKNGEYPEDFSVLEVGGGDNSAKYAFKGRVNYTDIDRFQQSVYQEGLTGANSPIFHGKIDDELGHTENGKLYENMVMDAFDIPEKFKTRKYDFMLAQGVFGTPTALGSREKYGRENPTRYELELLQAMSSALKDGGVIELSTREGFHVNADQVKKLGFDSVIKRIDSRDGLNRPFMILRKIPKSELAKKTDINS